MTSDIPTEAPVRRYVNWPNAHIEAHDSVMRKLQDFTCNVQKLTLDRSCPNTKDLAEACGIPASTITRIIHDKMVPTGRVIANIKVTTGKPLWSHHHSNRYGSQWPKGWKLHVSDAGKAGVNYVGVVHDSRGGYTYTTK